MLMVDIIKGLSHMFLISFTFLAIFSLSFVFLVFVLNSLQKHLPEPILFLLCSTHALTLVFIIFSKV